MEDTELFFERAEILQDTLTDAVTNVRAPDPVLTSRLV